MQNNDQKNNRVATAIVVVVLGMVGMSYAAVPLYELFCRITGYGGTTQIADDVEVDVIDRKIKVRFVANNHRDMPWEFKPKQNIQDSYVGEKRIALYEAYNPTNRTIKGTATFNVTPHKAGEYFQKIDCFCFTEQVLKPGERIDMPVLYFVAPEMNEDINLRDVTEITLSYTFFVMKDDEEVVENEEN
ncbi:cytochrome c oxidase assembly protein [Temperatibacter marinus]|uniref:Cytochrome c oxidase assembly protein CtaG n=1 Tax=Temperatibacter marinus TaxID=1456591 RepID=A0AA52EDV9_9PROT|nr:cytochrome c oxidase assembly protein [Temperatibacter marinus]WND02910.1 cytochrome c oxidase assembly protein [Temperatibacter marinus]